MLERTEREPNSREKILRCLSYYREEYPNFGLGVYEMERLYGGRRIGHSARNRISDLRNDFGIDIESRDIDLSRERLVSNNGLIGMKEYKLNDERSLQSLLTLLTKKHTKEQNEKCLVWK